MIQYCVEVVNVHLRNQPIFITGPFLDVGSAEQWIHDNVNGYYKGREFNIYQMIKVPERKV